MTRLSYQVTPLKSGMQTYRNDSENSNNLQLNLRLIVVSQVLDYLIASYADCNYRAIRRELVDRVYVGPLQRIQSNI